MKFKLGLFGVLAVLATASVLLIVPATGGAESGGGAVQITEFTCGFPDGNGEVFFTTGPNKQVNSPDGSWTLICKAKGVPNDTGHAVTWTIDTWPYVCNDATRSATTTDWQTTISKNGNATTTCHFDATVPV